MGRGWSNNYEIRLEEQPDNSIFIYWTPSDILYFTDNGSGTYT
jgi:hypothetical protein